MLSIPQKEANLFIQSEISKQYLWLVTAFTTKHSIPSLSKKDSEKLLQEQQNFLNLKWRELFWLAQSEWKITSKFQKNESKTQIDCELCGHKELDLLSEIENMRNGKKLIVGSTCIAKFDKIQNNSVDDYRKYQNERKKREKKILNEEYIEQKYSGIIKTIREFREIQNDDSVILDKKLADDYKRILEIIESDYEKQLKLAQSKIDLKIIQSTYLIVQGFLNDFEIYKGNCKSKSWGITPEIAKWCHKNGSSKLIELLQNFGEINIYTVDQIKEDNHLYNVVKRFKGLFKNNNMKLITNNKNSFNIISNMRTNIVIIIDTIQFLTLNKGYLFGDKQIKLDIKDLLRIGKISLQSYDNAINLICRHGNFKQHYKYYYADTNISEIAYVDNLSHKICVLDYNLFVQKFKYYVYENKIDIKKNQVLLNYVQENSIKYEQNDYRYHLKQLGIFIDK